MAPLNAGARADVLIDAVATAGGSAALEQSPKGNPTKLVVASQEGATLSVWVYCWTLTHGGGPRDPNEYRIQMTGVTSPLPANPEGLTLLMGYEPNLRVFAGFDTRMHGTFTAGSPSVQIDLRALRLAANDSIAFDRKGNHEIAIAIRPEMFLAYARHALLLHTEGADAALLPLLQQVATNTVPQQSLDGLPENRKKLVQTVTRYARAANFRENVMRAYSSRCAVTGIQLKLVEAAHILPVGAPGSTDEVRNGIALSSTYHRAFDLGLIYLTEDLRMLVNPARAASLASLHLDGGIDDFRASMPEQLLLPNNRDQRPKPALIAKANQYRRISN